MIKRAICKVERIDSDAREEKEKSKVCTRRAKARTIVSDFKVQGERERAARRSPLAARQSCGKQKHGRAVHYNTTSAERLERAFRQPENSCFAIRRARPLMQFLHNRVSSPNTTFI